MKILPLPDRYLTGFNLKPLRLSVYKLDSSTATMPTAASAYLQDGSVATQTQALTYETSAATTANLGDHMELRLEAVGASTVLRDYS